MTNQAIGSRLVALIVMAALTGCGAVSGEQPSAPASISPSVEAAEATPSSSPAVAPTASAKASPALQLPHGAAVYEMKVNQGQANVVPRFSDATLNKVRVVDEGVEFSAAPKGVAGINLPGVSADNFVASLRLKSVTGEGDYTFLLRASPGADHTGVRASTRTGAVGVNTYDASGKFKAQQLGAALMWPKAGGDEVSLAISVVGPVVSVYVNGAKVGQTKNTPVAKGTLTLNVIGPPDGDVPFVTRLTELAIYEPDPSALASAAAPVSQSLPAHGASLYELKIDPPAANIQVSKQRPTDKLQVSAGSVELSAAPGGGEVRAILPDLSVEDFVAGMRLRPVSGAGSIGLVFHATGGSLQAALVYTSTGNATLLRVALTPKPAGTPPAAAGKSLVGPLLQLAPNATEDLEFVVQAHGNELIFSLNGKEVGHASDPGPKGSMYVDAINDNRVATTASSPGGAPFVVRLEDLKVFAAA